MLKRTVATAEAPVNIALIKYWGKRDQYLNLPTNSSLSITLDSEEAPGVAVLKTRTTVTLVGSGEDAFFLNERKCDLGGRLLRVLAYIRSVRTLGPLRIESVNYFPTSAGLASSAAAYAALVTAINALLEPPLSAQEKSVAARLGSGSACRSLHEGFVQWEMGSDVGGFDSVSTTLFGAEHWSELRCLVVILSDRPKEVPSAEGMQRTVMTSTLYPMRLKAVPCRLAELTRAIGARDFGAFAELVMRDSNQFHAVCLDSFPPISYLTDRSHEIIRAVHALNGGACGAIAAYTFDAGPNAFVLCERQNLGRVEAILKSIAPASSILQCRLGKGPRVMQ